jgi:hypothetical protein
MSLFEIITDSCCRSLTWSGEFSIARIILGINSGREIVWTNGQKSKLLFQNRLIEMAKRG